MRMTIELSGFINLSSLTSLVNLLCSVCLTIRSFYINDHYIPW